MATTGSLEVSGQFTWDQALDDITDIVSHHEHPSLHPGEHPRGITERHWKPSGAREECTNAACSKQFGLLERHHHCRRCGDLFCSDCLKYRRKLNTLAHPDPQGQFYKVCHGCHDDGPQELGQTRYLTEVWNWYRRNPATASPSTPSDGTLAPTTLADFRDRLNLTAECQRLCEGFRHHVGQKSGIGRALSDIKSLVKTPEWTRSQFAAYSGVCSTCLECGRKFNLTVSRHMCMVCGAATCGRCSNNDLLVFIPDSPGGSTPQSPGGSTPQSPGSNSLQSPENSTENSFSSNGSLESSYSDELSPGGTPAQIAIIKIVGCPAEEPAMCMYLKVCTRCNQAIRQRQVTRYHLQACAAKPPLTDLWLDKVNHVSCDLGQIRSKIICELPKYQLLVESLGVAPGSQRNTPNSASNMQTLAKAQGNMADHLTQLVMTIQRLKVLRPTSQRQVSLLSNLIKAYVQFYHEKMFEFRHLQRSLEQTTPTSVLQAIQTIVDKNGNMADHLTQLVMTIQRLKVLRPTSQRQVSLLSNLIKAYVQFYHEKMFEFRHLQRSLEQTTPTSVLQAIQTIVDKNALTSCYLSVKQLCLETLHLSTKHGLGDGLPSDLAHTEEVIARELERVVTEAGDDWPHHLQCADQLIHLQLKGHRLIRPSRRLTAQFGATHIQEIIYERLNATLNQMHMQLCSKCADKQFVSSKDSLKAALRITLQRQTESATPNKPSSQTNGDWVWVDT